MTPAYGIRKVRSGEWRRLRELRLAALADPVSAIAFYETYESSAAKPDSLWQQRAAQAEDDREPITTFVAEAGDEKWAGMIVVYVEGTAAYIVAVYIRPEHRGTGVARQLYDAAADWAWARDEVTRLRLHVHERNARARAFYERLGFTPTGETDAHPKPPYGRAGIYELSRSAAGRDLS